MSYRVIYKKSVEKDFRKFFNKKERIEIKREMDSLLSASPTQGKKLRGQYEGLYSFHIRYKVIVVYKVFSDTVLVLGVEPRERSYKREYI